MSEENDLEALLRFDPFAEESGSGDGGGDSQQAGESGEDSAAPDGGGEAGSQQAGAEDAGKSGDEAGASDDSASQQKPDKSREPGKEGAEAPDAEKEALKEQLRQTSNAMQRMQSELDELKKSSKPADSGGKSGEDEAIPSYDFEIPNDIVEGIAAEDVGTRQAALRKLVAGMGHSFHSSVRQEVQQKLDAAKKEISDSAAQTAGQQTQTQQIYTDYFGQYPKHDSEVVRPIVQARAREVMREWNVQEWTPQVRDEIGRRVEQTLSGSGFVRTDQQPAQQGNGQGGKPSAPAPHMRRSGASPGSKPGGGPNSGDDIADTLFG